MNNQLFISPALALALLAGASMPAAAAAADVSATAENFAQTSLVAIRLAVRRSQESGKMPRATADCMAALKPDSLVGVYEDLLKAHLSEDERRATEAFFKSPTGIKYAKLNKLQVYQAMGQQSPEALPKFSSAELAEIESFGKTPAGEKLKVLKTPDALAPVNQRVNELIKQCNARK